MLGGMRKPRTNILLLATVLIVVGLIGRAWLAGAPASVSKAAVIGAAKPAPAVAVKSNDEAAITTMPATDSFAPRLEQLSGDASVLVVAMCDLQLMAGDTGLSLDSVQWSALAAVVVRTQTIRHNYEAQIATLKAIAPGKCRVEIPMYTRAGDVLRRQFTAELRAGLGEATATEVLAKIGERLEASFAGFGVSVQTLDITGNPATELGDVQIAQTTSYWNSGEGSDRLKTRHEIHFPAVEDPTGDSCDALLAMVGEASGGNGPI